jgi:hypothetical protein
MEFLVGILAIGVGLLAVFMGFRIFQLLLPIWGFVAGFVLGASLIAAILGTGFLRTILGLVAGVAAGIGFAAIAYLWWWVGVILAIGAFGYALGYAILPALGIDIGVINVLVGLAFAAALAMVAVVLRLPRAIIVVVTALWGAAAAVGGVLVILGVVELDSLGYGGVDVALGQSLLWTVAWLTLAIVGMVAQTMTSDDVALEPPTGPPSEVPRPPDPRIPGTY